MQIEIRGQFNEAVGAEMSIISFFLEPRMTFTFRY